MVNKPQVLFLSHGAGPLPLLGDAGHSEMVENLNTIAAKAKRPSVIIVISAHWEEKTPTITAAARPSLIYDYYGFPDASYDIEYPCPGAPSLAKQLQQLLIDHGMDAQLDDQRGFDHGLFVPLKIMYPEADIPCIQLSLLQTLDPAEHIELGRTLAKLDVDDLMVIGSGFSFHNLRAFFAPASADSERMNEGFEQWLIETCTNPDFDEGERAHRLIHWEEAPYARFCHPREEHLLPLHVCYGLAQQACRDFYQLKIANKKASVYFWDQS